MTSLSPSCTRRACLAAGAALAWPLARAFAPQPGVLRLPLRVRDGSARVAFAADGAIVVAASLSRGAALDAALLRFGAGGRPDLAFGDAGRAVLEADARRQGINALLVRALAIDRAGRIVVAGESTTSAMYSSDFFVARFLPGGRLDPSFGDGGWAATAIGKSHDMARGLAVLADGSVVAAGGSLQSYMLVSSRYDFALARYRPDGRPDPAFGHGGKVVHRVGSTSEDFAHAAAADARGRIVVTGYAHDRYAADMALLRFRGDGTPDRGFGRGGQVVRRFGEASAQGAALALQADGKVLVAGALHGAERGGFVLRYDDAGRPDPAFRTEGMARVPGSSGLVGVHAAADGGVLVGGMGAGAGGRPVMMVAHLRADGSPDAHFAGGGRATLDLQVPLLASGMAVSAAGGIVVCGTIASRAGPEAGDALVLWKLAADGRGDAGFAAAPP